MTNEAWETLSNQAVNASGVVYFLALLAYSTQWASVLRLPSDDVVDDDRPAVFGRFGLLLTAAAAAIHLVALVARGMAAVPNRVPWGNMYEFTLSGTFVVTLGYLVFYRRYRLEWLGPWVAGFVLVVLMADVLLLREDIAPLTEALSSPWLVIHVVAAILATGLFSLGGIVTVAYLVRAWLATRAPELVTADGTLLEADAPAERTPRRGVPRIPEPADLDRLAYRLHAIAFPIWTFAVLIAGPIWAHEAWSRYWGWDAKEVWAFITWVVYAAYLHARATAGWRGRNAAIVALIGLATLWFNFIGINFLFGGDSKHSYAEGAAYVEVVPRSL